LRDLGPRIRMQVARSVVRHQDADIGVRLSVGVAVAEDGEGPHELPRSR
jgi:hypothetical protein